MDDADANEHQAPRNTGTPWPPQRVPDLDLWTSLDSEPTQDNRAARLDEALARANQAARRIAAQQAERQASSDYAARMKMEAQTQAEARHQTQARDEVELEL